MQERRVGLSHAVVLAAAAPLAVATVLDLTAMAAGADVPPARIAAISWACLALGIGAGTIMTLLRVMHRADWQGDAARRLRRSTLTVLVGLGLAIGVLMLRGHPEIPPDPPLLGAQVIALALLLLSWPRRPVVPAGPAGSR
jgi:hypothetical protein